MVRIRLRPRRRSPRRVYRAAALAIFLVALPHAIPGGTDDSDAPLVFGGSASYPPFEWLDEQGRPRGFLIDVKMAIAERGGRRVTHELGEWSRIMDRLDDGSIDVVAMFESRARSSKYLFTEPFYYVTHAIFDVPGGSGALGPEATTGRRVAVVEGSYARARLAAEFAGSELIERPSIAGALQAVAAGRADLALVARSTAQRIIEDDGMQLAQVGPPFWPRPYVFAVKNTRPELRDWLRQNLHLVVAEGTYHRIYADWKDDLEWTQTTFGRVMKRLVIAIGVLMVLLVVGYAGLWLLRRRVKERTRELSRELERRQRAERELQYWAGHDDVTQLSNHDRFVRLVAAHVDGDEGARSVRATVMVVRLVELEQLISVFGYSTGERLVKGFAQRLNEQRLPAAGHFGRGVFGLLLPGDVEPASLMAELTRPLDLAGLELDPHLAAGRASYPGDGTDVNELMRRAETALAAASQRKRLLVAYRRDLEPEQDDLLLLRDFRLLGIEGLHVVYQPLVDLKSMTVTGVEALARWRHPRLGEVMPERFIPLLERAGITSRLTEFMIDEAARVAARLLSEGHDIPVSVNVSAVDLLETALQELVVESLKRHGAGRGGIKLEMTETSVIEDPVRVRGVVRALDAAGVKCSLDDFGVGFSSLSYLSDFPVSEIKIDRLFVADMLQNPKHEAIVRTTVALAHELNLKVVAEGVENRKTLSAIRGLNCDYAQGYHFSRPVAEREMLELIASRDTIGKKFLED